jgi:hypothetical protein
MVVDWRRRERHAGTGTSASGRKEKRGPEGVEGEGRKGGKRLGRRQEGGRGDAGDRLPKHENGPCFRLDHDKVRPYDGWHAPASARLRVRRSPRSSNASSSESAIDAVEAFRESQPANHRARSGHRPFRGSPSTAAHPPGGAHRHLTEAPPKLEGCEVRECASKQPRPRTCAVAIYKNQQASHNSHRAAWNNPPPSPQKSAAPCSGASYLSPLKTLHSEDKTTNPSPPPKQKQPHRLM